MLVTNELATTLGQERVSEMKAIGRYNIFDFYYRTDLHQHTKQVELIVRAMLAQLKDYLLNERLTLLYAAVHDDPEIHPELGDVQACFKRLMSADELRHHDALEEKAVDWAAERFGHVSLGDYTYEQVLRGYHRKIDCQAELVNLADKIAAYYEAVHELIAGNPDVITRKYDEHGREATHPIESYPDVIARIVANSRFLSHIIDRGLGNPLLHPPVGLPYLTIFKQGRPHTLDSIRERAANADSVYGAWLRLILDSGEGDLIENLTQRNCRGFTNCRP